MEVIKSLKKDPKSRPGPVSHSKKMVSMETTMKKLESRKQRYENLLVLRLSYYTGGHGASWQHQVMRIGTLTQMRTRKRQRFQMVTPEDIYRPEGETMELPDDDADYGPDRFPPHPDDEAQDRPQAEEAAITAGGDDRSGDETPEE
ncbi:MAG: hypothetical protein M1836_005679 [Candelina mexicana]|nr:MAG: hypothetical protein M1836_005679 [Candelina mexicana]